MCYSLIPHLVVYFLAGGVSHSVAAAHAVGYFSFCMIMLMFLSVMSATEPHPAFLKVHPWHTLILLWWQASI